MYLPTFIVAFIIINLFMSFFYFYLFARDNKGSFIRFWGLGWVFYSFSLLFLILYMNFPTIAFIGFRKIFDMLNISFLLFGAYTFVHIQIPSYWYRFSLYMVLWVGIGSYYKFDLISLFLPMASYQVIITLTLCYVILKHWQMPFFEKGLSIVVFLMWGMGKATLSILEVDFANLSSFYLAEVVFSNILNFCIFVIYIQRTHIEMDMAQALYRIVAENATDVIFYYTLTPQKAFTYITPSIEGVTGYSPNEFYNNPKFYYEIVPPGEFEGISDVFNAQYNYNGPYTKVFPLIHKNGNSLWIEFNVSNLYENGVPIAVEGCLRDITRMKTTEKELIASRKSRELLLSYVSHELRTPITSILGYVSALKDGIIKDQDEISSAMDIISNKSLMLERLINDLFQLSKLETKQFSFNFMRVDILELSENLLDKHLLEIKTADLKLTYKIDHAALTNCYIIADQHRIVQVFSNIISNAIKYTNPKDKLNIKFGLNRKKDSFSVSISDTGVGVCQSDLPFIFDRFYKSATPSVGRQASSTGLGLTISKEIIDAHNGTISVSSKSEKGSTFIFTIPLYIENPVNTERSSVNAE